jgi:alkylation response protein AidB-like acyl-CoA dehydrogenase
MFHEKALSEEQAMLRRFVADLAKEYGNAYFVKQSRADAFPAEFWKVLADNGFLGLEIPESLGGSPFQLADLVVLLYSLGAAGMTSFHLLDQLVAGHVLTAFADEAQKKAYWPALAAGEHWAAALFEDTTGGSAFACNTTAQKEGDTYVLNGSKPLVTLGGEAKHLLVAARTQPRDAANPAAGLILLAVDAGAPGITAQARELNVRVAETPEHRSATGDKYYRLELKDVRVPASALLGSEDGAAAKRALSRYLLMIAASAAGWGDRVIEQGVNYANQRVLYTEPISAYQAIQHPMVRAKTEVEMAKLLITRAVDAHGETDDADDLLTYSAMAKYLAAEAAFQAFDISMQAHGGSGFDRDTGLITLWPLSILARMLPMNGDLILEQYGERLLAPEPDTVPA